MTRVTPPTGEVVRLTNRIGVTAKKAGEIFDRQGGVCRRCETSLGAPGVKFEVDHRVPLALGGTNDIANLEALCVDCHKAKTKADITAIAKAKRLEVKHRLPRSEWPKAQQIKSRGFAKRDWSTS